MKWYYNTELQELESCDTIRSDYYDLFGSDYPTFDAYLDACMTSNNGVLITARDRLRIVKHELNRKLDLARKYGIDEYIEEVTDLMEQLDTLNKVLAER